MTKTLHDKLTEKFKDDPEYKRMYKELDDEESRLEFDRYVAKEFLNQRNRKCGDSVEYNYHERRNKFIADNSPIPPVEIFGFEKKLSVNSEKSPPHFSKTIDKHFWDLV